MTSPHRHKEIEISGERFRIKQMPARKALFLLSMAQASSVGKSSAQQEEEASATNEALLACVVRLKDVGGDALGEPLGPMVEVPGRACDPLAYDFAKQKALVDASMEYNVIGPLVESLPEDQQAALKAKLGR